MNPEPLLTRPAFARVLARLEAVPDADLRPLRVSPTNAARAVLSVLPALHVARPLLATLPGFDLERFDDLEDLALGTCVLDVERVMTAPPNHALTPIRGRAEAMHRLLLVAVGPLVDAGLLPETFVVPRRPGRAKVSHVALSLLGLAADLRAAWPAIAPHTTLTRELLDAATRLGKAVYEAHAMSETPDAREVRLSRARCAALVLLRRDYDEARRAYLYVMQGRPGRVDLPSFYADGFIRRAKTRAAKTDAPTPAVVSPPVSAPKRRPRTKTKPRRNWPEAWPTGGHEQAVLAPTRKGIDLMCPSTKTTKKTSHVPPKSGRSPMRRTHLSTGVETAPTPNADGTPSVAPVSPVPAVTAPGVRTPAKAPTDVDHSDTGFADQYARIKPILAAMPDDGLPPMAVDTGVMFTQAEKMAALIEVHEQSLRKLPDLDVDDLEKLPVYRDAFLHLSVILTRMTLSPAKVAELMTRVNAGKKKLLIVADALAAWEVIDDAALDQLRAGAAASAVAMSTLGTCNLLLDLWPQIGSRCPMTQDEIREIRDDARMIYTTSSDRAMTPGAMQLLQKERQKAFAAFQQRFNAAHRALAYLFPNMDLPSLAEGRSSGSSPKATNEPTPSEPTPTPATATKVTPAATTPAAAIPPATFTNVPVGHPGGNPFAS